MILTNNYKNWTAYQGCFVLVIIACVPIHELQPLDLY